MTQDIINMVPYLYVEFASGDTIRIEKASEDAVRLGMVAYLVDVTVIDCGLLYLEPGQSLFTDLSTPHLSDTPHLSGMYVDGKRVAGVTSFDFESGLHASASPFYTYSQMDMGACQRLHAYFATPPRLSILDRILHYLDGLLSHLQTPIAWPRLLRRVTTFLFPLYFLLLGSAALTAGLITKLTALPDWFRITFVSWNLWWHGDDNFA